MTPEKREDHNYRNSPAFPVSLDTQTCSGRTLPQASVLQRDLWELVLGLACSVVGGERVGAS